jgi:hypothetical protein
VAIPKPTPVGDSSAVHRFASFGGEPQKRIFRFCVQPRSQLLMANDFFAKPLPALAGHAQIAGACYGRAVDLSGHD